MRVLSSTAAKNQSSHQPHGMPRNAEVIRQWQILRTLERARLGSTIDDLAASAGVTTRTIRRDLAALAEAGFPLFDDRVDGRTRWHLRPSTLGGLSETGFTLTEAAALYFSRAVAEQQAIGVMSSELASAFDKFAAALGPVKRFLDRLPQVLVAKRSPQPAAAPGDGAVIGRVLDAMLHSRRIEMRYRSRAHRAGRLYRVEPSRLVSAEDGLYLLADVPEYGARRTFSVARIDQLTVLDEHFVPSADEATKPFAHSLGVHEGPPQRVRLWFSADVADLVVERTWHPSQSATRGPDGSATVTLDVALDWALKRWLLGFGGAAKVLSPPGLVREVRREIAAMRARYAPRPRQRG